MDGGAIPRAACSAVSYQALSLRLLMRQMIGQQWGTSSLGYFSTGVFMRNVVLFIAAALALAGATPVLASGGLPRLGDLRAGPYDIVLYNDSPALITGRNALTLELPSGVDQDGVRFVLLGAAGQALPVPLRSVTVRGGAADAHQSDGTGGHNSEMPGMPGMSHGQEPAATTATSTMLRGTVDLPNAGRWQASVSVVDHAGAIHTDEMTLDAVEGGPNRLYLLATASLIGGALVIGVAARHPATRKSSAKSTARER